MADPSPSSSRLASVRRVLTVVLPGGLLVLAGLALASLPTLLKEPDYDWTAAEERWNERWTQLSGVVGVERPGHRGGPGGAAPGLPSRVELRRAMAGQGAQVEAVLAEGRPLAELPPTLLAFVDEHGATARAVAGQAAVDRVVPGGAGEAYETAALLLALHVRREGAAGKTADELGAGCVDGLALLRDGFLAGHDASVGAVHGLGWLLPACAPVLHGAQSTARERWREVQAVVGAWPSRVDLVALEAERGRLGALLLARGLDPWSVPGAAGDLVQETTARLQAGLDVLRGLERGVTRRALRQGWPRHEAQLDACVQALGEKSSAEAQEVCAQRLPLEAPGQLEGALERLQAPAVRLALSPDRDPSNLARYDDQLRLGEARCQLMVVAAALAAARRPEQTPSWSQLVGGGYLPAAPVDPRSGLSVQLTGPEPTLTSPPGDMPWLPDAFARTHSVSVRLTLPTPPAEDPDDG